MSLETGPKPISIENQRFNEHILFNLGILVERQLPLGIFSIVQNKGFGHEGLLLPEPPITSPVELIEKWNVLVGAKLFSPQLVGLNPTDYSLLIDRDAHSLNLVRSLDKTTELINLESLRRVRFVDSAAIDPLGALTYRKDRRDQIRVEPNEVPSGSRVFVLTLVEGNDSVAIIHPEDRLLAREILRR